MRLLLVDDDMARAGRRMAALTADGLKVVVVRDAEETAEALALEQFDALFLSTEGAVEPDAPTLRLMADLAVQRTPSLPVFVLGAEAPGAVISIPAETPDPALAAEICRHYADASRHADAAAGNLTLFSLERFERQMAGDASLMREIVNLFRGESAQQLNALDEALAGGQLHRASRLAHSLKGSLGSLHADRPRYWAQALEIAATGGDAARSQQCHGALRETLGDLELELRRVLPE